MTGQKTSDLQAYDPTLGQDIVYQFCKEDIPVILDEICLTRDQDYTLYLLTLLESLEKTDDKSAN